MDKSEICGVGEMIRILVILKRIIFIWFIGICIGIIFMFFRGFKRKVFF